MISSPAPVRAICLPSSSPGLQKLTTCFGSVGPTTTGPSLQGVLNLANEESSGLLSSSKWPHTAVQGTKIHQNSTKFFVCYAAFVHPPYYNPNWWRLPSRHFQQQTHQKSTKPSKVRVFWALFLSLSDVCPKTKPLRQGSVFSMGSHREGLCSWQEDLSRGLEPATCHPSHLRHDPWGRATSAGPNMLLQIWKQIEMNWLGLLCLFISCIGPLLSDPLYATHAHTHIVFYYIILNSIILCIYIYYILYYTINNYIYI